MTRLSVLGSWAVEEFGETTSFLLHCRENVLLLDACPGLARQMHELSVKFTEIGVMALSHVHADHMLGFPYAVFKRGVQARQDSISPKQLCVVANSDTVSAARSMLKACYPERNFDINWITTTHRKTVEVSGFSISAFDVDHTVPTTALRIQTNEQAIGFIPDTRPVEGLAEFMADVDFLLVEAFGTTRDFGSLATAQKHLLAKEAGDIVKRANAKAAMLFHMHLPYRNADKQAELVAEFRETCDINPVLAMDLEQTTIS